MFEIRYKTVRYPTNLPYNCIFYVPGKNEVLCEEILQVLDRTKEPSKFQLLRDKMSQQEIQGFWFNFCLVRPEDFSEAEKDGNPKTLVLNILKDIFPVEEYGYFVVHLLPEKADVNKDADSGFDTLLLGTPDTELPIDPMAFAHIAAHENFQRMMGMTLKEYETREEAEKQIREYEKMIAQYMPVGGMMEFQTTHKRSRVHAEVVSRNREQVKNYYLDKFSEMINGPEPSFEELMELISAGYDDGNNTDKLQEPCPICAGYFEETDSYEVFLCPPDDEPIVCDFGRGAQTKALYIYFLRHAEGVHLKDLENEEAWNELSKIYYKLKYCDMDEAFDKAVAVSASKARSQAISDIRNLFNRLFVKPVASQYCIAPMDGKRNDGRYGIALDEEFIELTKPFDKDVMVVE